jgi:cytoskeletal protein RodZ
MTDQFAFLGDKRKVAIAAMSLGVLLLLPASLGFGGTMIIIQEAFGQFNLPLLEDTPPEDTTTPPEDTTTPPEDEDIVVEETPTTTTTPAAPTDTTTTVQDPSAYLMADSNVDAVRGFIGSTLPAQGAGGNTLTATDGSGHVATGRFRVFANDSAVESFVAEMNIGAIDGSSLHNVTIREGDPHRFEVTAGNGTAAASSNIVGNIFLDGGTTPVIDNVPMTLTIRGQVLAIQGIDIDEARITDTGQRGIISVIDGQTIYGTIPRT